MSDDTQHEVELPQGTIRYRDTGRGPILVFVHGLLVSGSLWRKVVPPLSRRYRCIAPDWPLGSHTVPMHADADLSPEGVARMIAAFLEALDLRDVTLVGNDSGGAICQLVVARHGERVARVVLTTCDAFEIFPPPLFEYLKVAVRVPGIMALLGKSMLAIPALQRLPIAYGVVSKRPIDAMVLDSWVRPAATDAGVRRDVAKFIRGLSPRVTLEVARELPGVHKPVLLAWTPEDRSFPVSLAHRLKDALPNARLVLIDDAFVFVAEDRPEALVAAIEEFVPSATAEPRVDARSDGPSAARS